MLLPARAASHEKVFERGWLSRYVEFCPAGELLASAVANVVKGKADAAHSQAPRQAPMAAADKTGIVPGMRPEAGGGHHRREPAKETLSRPAHLKRAPV